MADKEEERVLWRMMGPLCELWIDIGVEKLESHEGVTVKALLDSGATGLFTDKKIHGEARI